MVVARTVDYMGVLLMGGQKLIQIDSFFDGLAAHQAQNCLDHAYSMMLLVGVDRDVPISSKSQRQFKLAWSINLILVLAICVVLSVVVLG